MQISKETYIRRRAQLKRDMGSGVLLFLGNDEAAMNYADNTYRFRQDSTFLYFFGLDYAGLAAVIDVDNDREIIFGNELTIDDIVWTGTMPSLRELAATVGIADVRDITVEGGQIIYNVDKETLLVSSIQLQDVDVRGTGVYEETSVDLKFPINADFQFSRYNELEEAEYAIPEEVK